MNEKLQNIVRVDKIINQRVIIRNTIGLRCNAKLAFFSYIIAGVIWI